MALTGIVTKEQLTFIDNTVYSPKSAPLVARTLFPRIQVGAQDVAYRYKVKTGQGMAQAWTNRATDIPTVDETITEHQVPITEYALAAEYSWQELERAREAGVNLLADQAQLVARGMAEREDRIIFNGLHNSDSSMNIPGLTDKAKDLGIQEMTPTGSKTFDNMTGMELRKFFKDAVGKITHLPGYAGVKPALLLPQDQIDILDQPFNEYNPQMTVLSIIQPWFSQITAVPELEGQYWHAKNASAADKKKNMGIICVNTPDVCKVPDAMRITQLQPETRNLVTKVPFLARHGGLAILYPSAFVQLNNIN